MSNKSSSYGKLLAIKQELSRFAHDKRASANTHNNGLVLSFLLLLLGVGVLLTTSFDIGMGMIIGTSFGFIVAVKSKGSHVDFVAGILVTLVAGTVLLAVADQVIALASNVTFWQYVQTYTFIVAISLQVVVFAMVFYIAKPRTGPSS